MPQCDQHTASQPFSQAQIRADACWQRLCERLPADLEVKARQLGAFARVRAVPTASTLLRALLCYALELASLKQLSGWSRLIGVSSAVLSAPAWHKRLQHSAAWLVWLVGALLELHLSDTSFPPTQRILLVDATHLVQVGQHGETWRLHCSYDLLAGRLAWVQVSDHHQGESLRCIGIHPGDIVVADRGYCKAPQLLWISQMGAIFLVRYAPWHLPLYAPGAQAPTGQARLDVRSWLSRLAEGTYERPAVLFAQGSRLPVRLIARVLPKEEAAARRRQAQRRAREKGMRRTLASLFYAGFVLLVTTLAQADWEASLVLELYRCRWHIEILFKRIKQVLDAHRLPCRCPQTAQAVIAALLVGWLLIEEEAKLLRDLIQEEVSTPLALSDWQLDQWAWQGLGNVLRGWWEPEHLRALAPELRRLFLQKRRRPRLEHERKLRFAALVPADPVLVSVFDCSRA
jgi:hypothetical protein